MNKLLENKNILEQLALLKISLLNEGFDIDAIAFKQKGSKEFNVFNLPDFENNEGEL